MKVDFWLIVIFSIFGLMAVTRSLPIIYKHSGKYFAKMTITIIAIVYQLLSASIILHNIVARYPDLIEISWINTENLNIVCLVCAFELSYIKTLSHFERLINVLMPNLDRSYWTAFLSGLFAILTILMSIGSVVTLIITDVFIFPFCFTPTTLVYSLIFGGLLIEFVTLVISSFFDNSGSSSLSCALKLICLVGVVLRFFIFFISTFNPSSFDHGSLFRVSNMLFAVDNLCFAFILWVVVPDNCVGDDAVTVIPPRQNRVGTIDCDAFYNIGHDASQPRRY